jgi:hypothetical protein
MRKEINGAIMLLNMVCAVVCLQACHESEARTKPVIRHLAERHINGSTIYIDKADSRQVMRTDSAGAFTAYRIGFTDSLPRDEKYQMQRVVYYQFKMANDWKAVIGSDSISPVFYQPITGLNKMITEGILVFEFPAGRQPDALVYDDSFGDWQRQLIALTPHLN